MEDIDKMIDKIVESAREKEKWYEPITDFFEYTIWKNGIRDLYYNLKWYFKNLVLFQKQLWTWRPWDYQFQMELFAFGLDQVANAMENGSEVRESANKKIAACKELSRQLRRNVEDEIEWVRGDMTYSEKVRKATAEKYDEIHRLMKGQDIMEYKELAEGTEEEKYQHYTDWFDGSGIEGWWD